ncbi:MAG: serine/threonine-protein kinase PknK, partial [Deltaproteobacteria bacterium]|nr:serine/threonine-protein kinase PknK [Deltaproteobacteria bacterium]
MAAPDDDIATEILPSGTAPGDPVTAMAAAGASLIGRTLGKLTILEQLGQGGSGEVYRAEQSQLGRSAVIKVLRREIANVPNRVERFLREAKLASRLDHPYAAHVYAFGAEPDGVLWIAMEHVRGATLDELIAQRGALHPAVFAPLFGRLCEVVHSAHELGIVHRDIKGSNVMVIERAGQLLPKLLDFGIAKSDGGAPSPGVENSELTGHGATLGSPHYMSPEQWTSPGDVDARADIYALGVLAYRAVAGVLPFQGVARLELANAHLELAPAPLPASVAPALAEVILRALAKHPDARWQTALELGEAVRRTIGGAAPETVPILDPTVRDLWVRSSPQPIADAVAHLAASATTVEMDAALREVVAITCRWLAVIALAQLNDEDSTPELREKARGVVGRDHGGPWLSLARSIAAHIETRGVGASTTTAPALRAPLDNAPSCMTVPIPELRAALDTTGPLEALADRLDDRERPRTAADLSADVRAVAEALRPLEPLLAYTLVVGRAGAAESWQGARRRNRERVVVWGAPLPDGEVALLDVAGAVVVKLSPLVQVRSPLPSAEPELFLLWRSARGQARLVAAPWGFERDDDAAAQKLAMLTTEDADTQADASDDASPYPGLAAYGVADAQRFVGREREIEALANRLVRAPLIAVLGPSGAGKSSFIHAGVMARLAEQYELITMRPGRHPLHVLAALPPIGADTEDTGSIVDRLRALGERAPRGRVVVIDQLEELVTLCTDVDERRR